MNLLTAALPCAASLALASAARAQITLISYDGDLSNVDPVSGVQTVIGDTVHLANCLAPSGTGKLFTMRGNDLYEVDAETADTVLVGSTDVGGRGLAFHAPSGLLYAIEDDLYTQSGEDELWAIDPVTLQTARIGPTGQHALQSLAFHPNGELYSFDLHNNPQGGLNFIDMHTGQAFALHPATTGAIGVQWLSFAEDGTLYGGRDNLYEIDLLTGATTELATGLGDIRGGDVTPTSGCIGENYECPSTVTNSSGLPGEICAVGSIYVVNNDVTLEASQCPPFQFGYFLNSPMMNPAGFNPPGSQGRLCIGPACLGRYNRSGEVFQIDHDGTASLVLDLTDTPSCAGSVPILPGQTWCFSTWFRDINPMGTSNFTDGVLIVFQ